jgi:hypothetical protein
MNAQSVLRSLTRYLRREDYASAVLLANNELLDGHLDVASFIADALDEWEAVSTRSKYMAEHSVCFRSVYRSMLFEDFLRRAIGAFIDEHPIPPQLVEIPVTGQDATVAVRLRLSGLGAKSMDDWLQQQWDLTRQVTQHWTAPKHNKAARPLSTRN